MQINWQQIRRLLVIFVGDIGTELTFLQGELQKIRETSSNAEITLLLSSREKTEDKRVGEAGKAGENKFSITNYPLPIAHYQSKIQNPKPKIFTLDSRLPTLDSQLVDRIITHTTTWQDPAQEKKLVEKLSQFSFDAAIILTNNNQSPYPFAYLVYLAGIPIRAGRSREFGGSVLSVIS